MEVHHSDINGDGLFASRDYSADEEVLKFPGTNEEMVYINHSCNPSCYIVEVKPEDYESYILYAKRQINTGEEITQDYRIGHSDFLWEKTVKGICNCEICRK